MRFALNPLLEHQLKQSLEVGAAVKRRAERVAERARAIAPVDTGAYRDSIRVESGVDSDGVKSSVVAGVDYGAYVEFGTEDTPPFAPLRRAAHAAEQD